MAIFKKRESLTQNIAYMGIMAAINVIFVLITHFVPILFLLLIFVLPFTSTVVTLFCKKKYFIIYAIATVGLCMLISLNNISDTLFYVIPSLISGFIFGFMIEKKCPSVWIILVSSIFASGIAFAFVPFIKFLYGQDMIQVVASAFGLKDFQYLDYVVGPFIFLISIVQSTISFFIIKNELPKLSIELQENSYPIINSLCGLLFFVLTFVFSFFFPQLSYVFTAICAYFAISIIADFAFDISKVNLILCGVALLVSIVIFVSAYNQIEKPLGLLLVNTFFALVLIIGLVNNCLTKSSKSLK